jgi:CRISPR system Cascade subunit CasC
MIRGARRPLSLVVRHGSDCLRSQSSERFGARTQRLGSLVHDHLVKKGADEAKATEISRAIADVFGKIKSGDSHLIEQLAFVSPDEREAALEIADTALAGDPLPKDKELTKLILRRADGAADVAMFGRMLADDPDFNREAAVQISHAVTTHRAMVEDDFYTAVDDLKTAAEDAGAGFVGDAGFGSGVYYLYACVDCDLLEENLAGDRALAKRAVAALISALATATPGGKQASFAHRPRAGHIRAEFGTVQPRSLAGAFFKPVTGDGLMSGSVKALTRMAEDMDAAYGPACAATATMDVEGRTGTLAEIIAFAEKQLDA